MTGLDAGQQGQLASVLAAAVARAAVALHEMIADEVMLSAPTVQCGTRHSAADRLDPGGNSPYIAVKQRFRGRFSGDALLVFPEKDGLDLVRAILAEAVPLDMMTELEQDALVEVSNIVLNACLGSIAAQLGERLHGGVPQSMRGTAASVCDSRGSAEDERRGDLLVLQRLDFQLGGRPFLGFLALAMDSLSAACLERVLFAAAKKVPA